MNYQDEERVKKIAEGVISRQGINFAIAILMIVFIATAIVSTRIIKRHEDEIKQMKQWIDDFQTTSNRTKSKVNE